MERNKINTAVVNKKQLMKKIHVSGQQLIIQMYYNYITLHTQKNYQELVNRLKDLLATITQHIKNRKNC